MAGGLNYFIFNKEQDYQRGYCEHMEYGPEGIWVQELGHEKAVFLSRVLDSRETQMNWHRLTLKDSHQNHAPYKITVYAADVWQFVWQGEVWKLSDLVSRTDIALEDKIKMMEPFWQKCGNGTSDMLLHEVTGRYLWILMEAYRQGEQPNYIKDITIYFPRQSWLGYLPEIYQKEDGPQMFLERYLAIFQTLYEDLNQEIRNSARYFDMESTKQEFLDWLAQWLNVEEYYIWPKEKLRILLSQAVFFYKKRGTRQGLLDFVKLYNGEEPFIVEYFQLQEYVKDKDYYQQLLTLYGDDANTFAVIARESVVHNTEQYKILETMIDSMKPAHMGLNLIIIKPYIFLNGHSYLGINSVLGQYRTLVLNGRATLPFLTVGEHVI